VKSVEALATQEATVLKSKRMSTISTTTPIIILNRIEDGTNRIKGGISNKDLTTQVTTQVGNNLNEPPLREMIVNQNKVIDNMSRKIASNDKVLETINNRMDSFTSAIKNQLSFNKMIESQIS
jgi:ABC-type transporter Mla subunit MlaD